MKSIKNLLLIACLMVGMGSNVIAMQASRPTEASITKASLKNYLQGLGSFAAYEQEIAQAPAVKGEHKQAARMALYAILLKAEQAQQNPAPKKADEKTAKFLGIKVPSFKLDDHKFKEKTRAFIAASKQVADDALVQGIKLFEFLQKNPGKTAAGAAAALAGCAFLPAAAPVVALEFASLGFGGAAGIFTVKDKIVSVRETIKQHDVAEHEATQQREAAKERKEARQAKRAKKQEEAAEREAAQQREAAEREAAQQRKAAEREAAQQQEFIKKLQSEGALNAQLDALKAQLDALEKQTDNLDAVLAIKLAIVEKEEQLRRLNPAPSQTVLLDIKRVMNDLRQAGNPYNFFQVFGIAPNADDAMIKEAYKNLVKSLHPDKNSGREAEVIAQFKIVQNIYDILSNPASKQQYLQMISRR